MKNKSHVIISMQKKELDKIQHFYDKNFQQTGCRGKVPQHSKSHV